ncbi:MAG: 3-dehydroquinate synthase [Pseudobdellovibrionaceae bacterium]
MFDMHKNIEEIKALLTKPIVLVGLMGVGKSTVGRMLAEYLGRPFYDSDDSIVASAGKSISRIFAEDGEPAFRQIERDAINGLLGNGPCVIASGGGAISVPETAHHILEKGLCIWVDAPIDLLVERTQGSDRPLLRHGDPSEVLASLFEKRVDAYRQAHIHVRDEGLTVEEAAARILLQIREYLFSNPLEKADEKYVPQALCLDVSLFDRSYPIFIGSGLLDNPEIWLNHEMQGRKAFILVDYTVRALLVDKLQQTLASFMKSVAVMELPVGEQTKSFDRYEAVMEWLVSNGVTRDSIIFAVGGGVIGDLAGFAASTILRGIDFVQIPTTILSQVDSSVGGKTGINSSSAKNMIGTFYQPKAVVIDLDTLMTLPQRQWLAGYAEIVKYALIGDAAFFEWLGVHSDSMLNGDTLTLMRAIETSCRMKAQIVELDEHEETGLRATLNLGHTFGHALEALLHYDGTILHGEAVAIGLVLAARLSQRLSYISKEDVKLIENHLKSVGLRTELSEVVLPEGTGAEDFMAVMRKDKKATANGMVFVVLKRIGEATLEKNIPEQLIFDLLTESLSS